jgi:hypothetical protein
MNINKSLSKNTIYLYSLLILVFVPKIDLLSIDGYWQGIRTEDLILFVYCLYFLVNYDKEFLKTPYQYKAVLIILIYSLFTNSIGYYSGLKILTAVPIRFVEYIILIIFLNNLPIKGESLKNISIVYILVNLLAVIAQEFDLIGAFTSLGYLAPDHPLNARALGIAGGSWELSILAPLSFFMFLKYENSRYKILTMFIALLIIMILAEARANFVTFIVVCLLLFMKRSSLKVLITFLVGLFIIVFLGLVSYLSNHQAFFESVNFLNEISIFNRIRNMEILLLFDWIKDFIVNNNAPNIYEIAKNKSEMLSFAYRLNFWSQLYTEYKTNIFTTTFGTGMTRVYVESTLIRIWFTSGYIGLILVLYMSRKLPVYQFVFFLLTGFSLDIFISFKIMLFALLLNKKTKTRYENSY